MQQADLRPTFVVGGREGWKRAIVGCELWMDDAFGVEIEAASQVALGLTLLLFYPTYFILL